ncbi:MAG TPA: hypothetical protein VGC76_18340 [Pyrinomonadaceae bacterium]|jgi:hypothetical protein
MVPRIEGNNTNQFRFGETEREKKVEPNPNPPVPVINPNPFFSRQSEFNFFGTQQRDRIERFYGAGSSAVSSFNDIRLANATREANWAYARTYRQELNALSNPTLSANPPANLVEVAARAEFSYRAELSRQGFAPLDVRGASALKAVDFLNFEAARGGNFSTAAPTVIQNRLLSGESPTYFVRVVESKYLTSSSATFSRPGQPNVWVATAEEIAGARLDGFEVMKRVGFDDTYINRLAASGKKPSDFTLVVVESRGTSGTSVPTWDRIFDLTQGRISAGTSPDLLRFRGKPASFWDGVRTFDYRTHLDNMERLGLKPVDYANTLTRADAETFLARNQIEQNFGVNKFFTADGRTARTDGANSGYGVREFLIDNNPVARQQRQAYIQLQETGVTNLEATNRVPTIAENPLRLNSEVRNGALLGGGMSAVTSLPQIFEQAGNGDYLGAGETLVTNTSLGATVGGAGSFGERVIGNQITNRLGNSALVQNGLERLYTNGAARSVVSRFASTESTALTSQAFNSTARTIAGRVGGAGIVGGIINGGFAAYDQIRAYNRGEVTASQAIGTVAGEAGVGVAAGMAGAAAGAAIGSIIPGAGTIVGGVIGFVVGVGVGVAVDWGLRQLGADKAVAQFVTGAIDAGAELASKTGEALSDAARTVGNALSDAGSAITGGLKSIFG